MCAGLEQKEVCLLLVLLPTGCPNLGFQCAGRRRRRRSRHSLGDRLGLLSIVVNTDRVDSWVFVVSR